jgi:hypothetical protein
MIPIFKHIIDTFVLREQVLMEPYVSASFHAELDSTNYYFRWGIAQEVKSDTSKVFALLKDLNYGIPVLRKAKKGEIVEVLTFEKKKPPIVTYNCPERFPIEAIILKFFMGRYRIEEIRYRKIIKP